MKSQTSATIMLVLICAATPALAQTFDATPFTNLFQSILDALTGTPGRLAMTIVAFGVVAGGLFHVIDWSRVIMVCIGIVLLGSVATIVEALWGGRA